MKIGRLEIKWKKKLSKAQVAINLAEQALGEITSLQQEEYSQKQELLKMNNLIIALNEHIKRVEELVKQLGNN